LNSILKKINIVICYLTVVADLQ